MLFQRRSHNGPLCISAIYCVARVKCKAYVGHRLQELSMPSLYVSGRFQIQNILQWKKNCLR